MWKYLNKGISTPIAISIILILVILVGGFTWWQYEEMWRESVELPEIELPEKEKGEDKTVDWKTYRNEDWGFEFEYPYEGDISIEENVQTVFPSEPMSLLEVRFRYEYEEFPFGPDQDSYCGAYFLIDIKDKFFVRSECFVDIPGTPTDLCAKEGNPIEILEEIKELFDESEYIIVGGEKALRRNEFIGYPPGGGGEEDFVWLPKDSKVYMLIYSNVIDIYENSDIENDVAIKKCEDIHRNIFEHMLSTFKFLD